MARKKEPTKEDLARAVDSLRTQVQELKREHAEQINAKNRLIRQLEGERNAELAGLYRDFPNLQLLIRSLHKATDLAEPLRSKVPNPSGRIGVRLGDDGIPEDPMLSSDGLSTRAGRDTLPDRNRVDEYNRKLAAWDNKVRARIDAWISDWSHQLERSMSPKEVKEETPSGPQCWNPNCPSRAYPQALDRTTCISCGEPFGAYQKPFDHTRTKRPQCWTEKCPRRGRTYDDFCPGCGRGIER